MTTLPAQLLTEHIVSRDFNKVCQLLQGGSINLDERDENGQTFLMVACQVGHLKIVRQIIDKPNVDVNAVDNDNWSALLNAARYGYHDIVGFLLEKGAEIDHSDVGQWTALMWACYKGHRNAAFVLLNSGANPNVKGEHHMSCLTWAAGRGHTEIVKGLLENGAKVNTADKYGTTPLIWASRKGFKEIVVMLLEEGANVDNSGMNSYTALLISAKGKFEEVVDILLKYHPNVNAVDKDGYTALTWGAKEGNLEIVKSLLTNGAYVNVPDRYGDTILIHAVKGGHLEVVRALLKKYADVDVEGVDGKTALYWAVEKAHVNIAKLLLNYNANTDIANKLGDTPLLKAVRSRNFELVKVLLDKNAKVSIADKRGDTPMHIAIRSRSKRITELLLRNPKDGRLLYRPNKTGETPYQLDMGHEKSILTQVFGARNLNASDNIRGYELYSSTIADVLSEPSLHTPITVGLYAKWGSGKSFLIDQLVTDMSIFARQQAEPEFEFSFLQAGLSIAISLLVGIIVWLATWWPIGLAVGCVLLLIQYICLGLLKLLIKKKNWRWTYSISQQLAKKLMLFKLMLQLFFCHEPVKSNRDTRSVKFLFTKNARLASVVGEKSITAMISSLCESFEEEYGVLVSRFYRVLKPSKVEEGRGMFKTMCCIPYFVISILIFLCVLAGVIIISLVGVHNFHDNEFAVYDGVIVALALIVGITFLGYLMTGFRMLRDLCVPTKRRVNKIGSRLESLKMEGFMQSLKKEVELMGHMTNCMDAFTNTHTRLVVIVDGLDSCEQEKLLQVLDTLHMLFGDAGSPFVTILAVDPHVIVKGIEHNLQGLFRDSNINGHDYLRNIVQLPFFLQQNQGPPRRYQSRERENTITNIEGAANLGKTRLESQVSQMSASQVSLADRKASNAVPPYMRMSTCTQLQRQPSQIDLSRSLGKNAYFSDVNPRNMKRLMNIIAVTGRLLRAHSIEFSWYKLAAWINITEQWPYRLSWMILEIEDNSSECEDNMTLKNLYNRVQSKIPTSKEIEPLLEIDRNARKLDLFLTNHSPVLTIADMKRFMPCTINLDPYLRKLITELQNNIENQSVELLRNTLLSPIPGSEASFPFSLRSRNISGDRGLSPASRTLPRGYLHSLLGPATLPMSPALIQMMHNMATPSPHPQAPTPKPEESPPNARPSSKLAVKVTRKPTKGPRIKVKGGLPTERLSSMALESVCELLQNLEGMNKNQLPAYQSRIEENNITGQVLLTCDLTDLKPVMAMTFGDWELFRTLITILREREAAMESNSSSMDSLLEKAEEVETPRQFEDYPANERPYHQQRTSIEDQYSVSSVYESGGFIKAPKPLYAQSSMVENPLRSQGNERSFGTVHENEQECGFQARNYDIENPVDISDFKCKPASNSERNKGSLEQLNSKEFVPITSGYTLSPAANMRVSRETSVTSIDADISTSSHLRGGMIATQTSTQDDVIEPEMLEVGAGPWRLKRVDSMVTEVLHEANYLHELMDAVGVGEDLSEVEEAPPEETEIDMTQAEDETSKDTKTLLPPRKRPKKRKKTRQQAELFTGNSSGFDTDAKSNHSAYSAGPDEDSDSASEKEMEILQRRSSQRSRVEYSRQASVVATDANVLFSTASMPFDMATSVSSEPGEFMAKFCAGGRAFRCGSGQQNGGGPSTSAPGQGAKFGSGVDMTGLSPSVSHEYLAMRKLGMQSDITSPSAFAAVTPGSSRASTRPPSCAESTKSGGRMRSPFPAEGVDTGEASGMHQSQSQASMRELNEVESVGDTAVLFSVSPEN